MLEMPPAGAGRKISPEETRRIKAFWILFKGDWRFSIGGLILVSLVMIAIFAPEPGELMRVCGHLSRCPECVRFVVAVVAADAPATPEELANPRDQPGGVPTAS